MRAAAGIVLVAIGAWLALPQVFTVVPDQRAFVAGVVLAIVGAALIADNQPRAAAQNRRRHGHR